MTMQRSGAALLVGLALSVGASGSDPNDPRPLLRPGLRDAVPESLALSADGQLLYFSWDDGAGPAVWRIPGETESGTRLFFLSEHGLDGVDGLAVARGDWLLLESDGGLFLGDPAATGLRSLTPPDRSDEGAKLSPDRSSIAFSRDGDLWVHDLASGRDEQLTHDGSADEILNGTTDWVYWEEIWDRDSEAIWWSPDGSHIAFYRFDETGVLRYPLPAEEEGAASVRWQRYPTPGTTLPEVRVGVVQRETGRTIWLQAGEGYLARVSWLPAGDRVAVQRLDREQDRLELLTCSIEDGACRVLWSESHSTWINLGKELRFLADGGFLWATERSGRRRLWLHHPDGRPRAPVSPDDVAVTGLIDLASDEVFYQGFPVAGLGSVERHLYRSRLDGSRHEQISDRPGWHEVVAVAPTKAWVESFSSADSPPQLRMRRAGDPSTSSPALLSRPPPPASVSRLPRWRFLEIPGPGGERLPAALLEPAERRGNHPALVYQYGSPGGQVVRDSWGNRGQWHRWMAARGYAVLMLDGPASPHFGRAGEDRLHRRFGENHRRALLAGVDYLRSLGWVDSTRIGLWGWSGGGSNTLYNILHSPGVWAAAVAGAPVTDWNGYDAIWTERYLDHPEQNADGYSGSSPLSAASTLSTPLLIVHGLADDNVHPGQTLSFVKAVIAAGRSLEQAFYPGEKHGLRDESQLDFYYRMTEFFDRHLAPADDSTPRAP